MAPRVIAAELMHFVPSNLALYKRPVVTSVNPYYLAGHIDEAIELIGRMNNGSRLTGTSHPGSGLGLYTVLIWCSCSAADGRGQRSEIDLGRG